MTLRVYLTPTPEMLPDDTGIGRIIHAQYRDLPAYGIEFVREIGLSDVIACHIDGTDLPRVDILHTHGLYWQDIPHTPYARWHHTVNHRVAATARRAHTITVPSAWVAEPFKRDMRIEPIVIGHGIDLAQWEPADHKGYVLWNKNRPSDVCSTDPVIALADVGIRVVSTFGPANHPHILVTGTQSHERMRELIRHAAVYLATTPETFGIGTLEAMACGVPVLGYDWCGTADLVRHGIDGYLVAPGDSAGLQTGCAWIMEHRERLSAAARTRAQDYGWPAIMARYADLYYATADAIRSETHRVSVVITNYNYAPFLEEAIGSVLTQADEVIVVDDGSTDASLDVTDRYRSHPHVHVIAQENQGVAAARNTGIAAATGEYIVCLDADDRLAPGYITACADALQADRGLGIAYTGLALLHPDDRLTPSPFPPPFDWAIQATPANPPATCIPTAAMFRRSLWERAGGYKQVYAPGEDAEFYTRGLSVGYTARKVSTEPLMHYRLHEGSASRTRQYRPIDTWHPWMHDGQAPFAAPAEKPLAVRSYALPLVSVIIPVGPSHARYLPAALDSLLGQTFRNWEAIVINDQAEPLPMQAYPFAHAWETYDLDGDGNPMGAGFARNAGLGHARAPLVLFLDADDWLHPDALTQMLMAYAAHGHYVYTDWVLVKDGNAEPRPSREYDALAWLPDAKDSGGLHAVTVLMETAHARAIGFDRDLPAWEDWQFFCEAAIRGICGKRLAQHLLYVRSHDGARRSALTRTPGLRERIRGRYKDHKEGKKAIMGCCGGSGALMGQVAAAVLGDDYDGGAIPDDKILVRYTGAHQGDVTYSGSRLQGKYRVSALNPLFLALKADAEFFRYQADFRIEEPSAPKAAPTPDPVSLVLGTEQPTERRDYGDQDHPMARAELDAAVPTSEDAVPDLPPTPTPEAVAQARAAFDRQAARRRAS